MAKILDTLQTLADEKNAKPVFKSPQEKKLAKLSEMLKLMDEMVTKEDVLIAFETILKVVKDIKETNVKDVQYIKEIAERYIEKLEKDTAEKTRLIKDRLNEIKDGEKGKDGKDGKDADEEKIVQEVLSMIPPPADFVPETAEQIRDKLETLEGKDRLPVSAIDGLEEQLKSVKNLASTRVVGSNIGGNIVKAYDLSGSLDGSTRTFALPAFWRIISVHLSSFPNILRPTVDFTTDTSAMTITFTSEVQDNSLSSGQTLIIVYATGV